MASNKRILLILPEPLLALTDEAADTLQMSRLAFIRQAIAGWLTIFQRNEQEQLKRLYEERRELHSPFIADGSLWFRDAD